MSPAGSKNPGQTRVPRACDVRPGYPLGRGPRGVGPGGSPGGASYKPAAALRAGVTRAAVREGFERYVDRAVGRTAEAFRVGRALREGGPGSGVVDRLLGNSELLRERVVQPELDAYRGQVLEQFETLLDYVESGDDIGSYREPLLAADAYEDALRPDLPAERRAEVRDRLVERQRRFGEALAPVVAAEKAEFWPAVTATLSEEEAVALVETHFAFTEPLRADRDAFRMAVRFDPGDVLGGLAGLGATLGGLPAVEVDYTDEALRAMGRAEEAVVASTKRDLEERYG